MRVVFKGFMRFQRFYEISKTFWGHEGSFDSTPPPHCNTHTSDSQPDPFRVDTDNLFARHESLWVQGDEGTP